MGFRASLVAQMVKRMPAMRETQVRFLGGEDPLEKDVATHSSILAWKSHGWRSLVGYSPRNSPGKNAGKGSRCSLLQGIFPTQELNGGSLHCRWILYQLSYQESLSEASV